MAVYHISRARWDVIRAHGYPLGEVQISVRSLRDFQPDNVYHFLDDDESGCPICSKRAQSLLVNTPVELEEAKLRDN